LQKAARLHQDAIDPHRLLAEAYTQLGQEENATRELSEAERIQANGGTRMGTQVDDQSEVK
jgi:Flp pilus assembly protein TadD